MSKLLPVFTIQTFNQTALQPAGAVFAQRVESINLGRSFFAGTGSTGRNTMMEKKMNDLTQGLVQELDIQAKKMYPNAVALVDVEVYFSDIGKTDSNMLLAGQASATALIKRIKPIGQSMVPTSSAPMGSPISSAPMSSPIASAPMGSPIASAPAALAPLSPQNTKNIVVPKAISGGKRKSFISKSRKNRKQE